MGAIIVSGIACVLVALAQINPGRIDIYLVLIALFTIAVGSRVIIQIPRLKSHISVSDTLIYVVFLLYGGEFAVILAAAEATASAWRFCNQKLTVFFNAATMAVSTGSVVVVLTVSGLYGQSQVIGHGDYQPSLIIVLSLIALTPFIVNTALAAIHDAIKERVPLWETWKNKYIWTFFAYFVAAAGAGLLVQIAASLGIEVIVAAIPVMFFVFLSYRMYSKNVEISIEQAEQAKQYVQRLETQADALRESEERFRSAFDHAPIGIGLVSPTGNWLKVNHALTEILGYSEDEFLSTDFQSITLPDDLGPALLKVCELQEGKISSYQMEQRYLHKSGETVSALWSMSASGDTKSRQTNFIFQLQDITGKKSAEEKLQHEATHDALTGLPNRPFFMDRLKIALEKARRLDGYNVSVLFIDLDRFKYVNDSLGHLMGDRLLKEISSRLRECMRPSDIVARLGGDEFTVLAEGTYDTSEVTRMADRIQKKFSIPFDLGGHEVYSSASIGILHASEKHQSPEDIMRDADTAMYQAKRAGKARHVIFDDEMHDAAKEILRLETDLRRAVEREEISVFYQPIYDLRTGEIDSFEALARWQNTDTGLISPTKFIPLAEEIGLIDRLCEQVLRRACGEIGSLQNRGALHKNFSISINLSCHQFSQESLVPNIRGILRETGFLPSNLKIEITESVFFEHHNRAIVMLNQLRDSGIEINIDDFGTGYSNLGYLKKLPITALKIDRSFVSMIDAAGRNDEIVRAIITLARNLDLTVIAEGIETTAQLHVLKNLKCEGGQGFLLADPMSFEDLRAFLANQDISAMPQGRFSDISTLSLSQ